MENNEQAPLEVEVEQPGSPESPQPSPGSPSPVFGEPAGDASTFIGFYSLDDLIELEEWARRSRELRGRADYVMVEPGISDNLRLFLIYTEEHNAVQDSAPFRRRSALPTESIFKGVRAADSFQPSAVGPAVPGLNFVWASRTAEVLALVFQGSGWIFSWFFFQGRTQGESRLCNGGARDFWQFEALFDIHGGAQCSTR